MALRRFARDESGVAILEFAIFASLFLLLTFGALELGTAMFKANALTSAVREGARTAAALSNPNNATRIHDVVMSRLFDAGFDTVTAGVKPTVPAPLCTTTTSSTPSQGNCASTSVLEITVTATYPLTWLKLGGLMGWSATRTLTARATFRWEGAP